MLLRWRRRRRWCRPPAFGEDVTLAIARKWVWREAVRRLEA